MLGRDEKSIKDNGNSTESEILCVFPLECYDFIAGITVRQRSRKEWSAEHGARSREPGAGSMERGARSSEHGVRPRAKRKVQRNKHRARSMEQGSRSRGTALPCPYVQGNQRCFRQIGRNRKGRCLSLPFDCDCLLSLGLIALSGYSRHSQRSYRSTSGFQAPCSQLRAPRSFSLRRYSMERPRSLRFVVRRYLPVAKFELIPCGINLHFISVSEFAFEYLHGQRILDQALDGAL